MIDHEVKPWLRKIAMGPEGVPLYSQEQKGEERCNDRRRMCDDKIKGLSLVRIKEALIRGYRLSE